MYGEYGYMEEGKLGKPYNLKLLGRLARYALPYKKTIAFALFLSILITVGGLALPYLTKIAIDRYILSSWYLLDTERLNGPAAKSLEQKYARFVQKSSKTRYGFISNLHLKKIDPLDLQILKTKRYLSPIRYYAIPPSERRFIQKLNPKGLHEMPDGTTMIPYTMFRTMPKKTILAVRAKDVRGVASVGLVFFFLLVVSYGFGYGEHYLLEFAGQHIMQDIRLSLFRKIESQGLGFFNTHPVGRLVTRVTNDIENLNEMFKSVMITVFKDFFLLLGILGVLLYIHWRLALVCFALVPFIFALTLLFSSMARDAFRELRSAVAKINAFLQERLTGMRIIHLFAAEKSQGEQFAKINHENYLAGMRQIRIFAVFMPVMELFSALAVALLIWHGGGKVLEDQISLGALVAFVGYIQMFFKPIRDISEKYNIMQSAMASTERIFEFMDAREEIPEPSHPMAVHRPRGHLLFQGVSFSYDAGPPVLQDISFEIRPGETVALVGHTGSGKTTLVNLLERFYDPNEGAIFLDDVDLRLWPKKELRKAVGLVSQDVFIFAASVKDNISLGRNLDDPALKRAADQANVSHFIGRLTKGFQYEISERGTTLSAGERQLLSFARVLAYDPRVLILDEATSNVDPETERLIQEAILKMAAERTTLVVAHRLSTIRNADRILVLHHGRLVEEGTHDQLIALGGVYYNLIRVRE